MDDYLSNNKMIHIISKTNESGIHKMAKFKETTSVTVHIKKTRSAGLQVIEVLICPLPLLGQFLQSHSHLHSDFCK